MKTTDWNWATWCQWCGTHNGGDAEGAVPFRRVTLTPKDPKVEHIHINYPICEKAELAFARNQDWIIDEPTPIGPPLPFLLVEVRV